MKIHKKKADLEQSEASVQLEYDTTNTPHITRL